MHAWPVFTSRRAETERLLHAPSLAGRRLRCVWGEQHSRWRNCRAYSAVGGQEVDDGSAHPVGLA
jgi:hypothetical protein